MEFTFLGTSSGVPTRQRNVSALALRKSGEKPWYLIDCGEGTQHRLLKTSYTLPRLAAIFITHMHGDHCFGLPGLLASAGMANRSETLTLIGPAPLRQFVETALRLSDSYLPYELKFLEVESLESWQAEGLGVEKWPLSHRVPSYAYSFTETAVEERLNKEKLMAAGIAPGPAWGKLLAGEPAHREDGTPIDPQEYLLNPRKARRIVVGGDNDDPELLTQACQTADLLIHESTFTREVAERLGPSRQHSHATGVAEFAERVKLPNLILTHFSARYQQLGKGENSVAALAAEASQHYSGHLQLAEDLATYHLDKLGNISRSL